MGKLRIEAKENWVEHGGTQSSKLIPQDVTVQIFDDDKLMAETTLEALVTKFLYISGEYAQAMALLGAIEANHKSRIIIAKPGDIDVPKTH